VLRAPRAGAEEAEQGQAAAHAHARRRVGPPAAPVRRGGRTGAARRRRPEEVRGVQGGEVHMRARIQGAGRGHYQAKAPAKLLFAPVSVRQCCRMCAVVVRTV
jgi:hypothetical protein